MILNAKQVKVLHTLCRYRVPLSKTNTKLYSYGSDLEIHVIIMVISI